MTDYPEEIYVSCLANLSMYGRAVSRKLEEAYDLGCKHGKADRDTLDGWSNLTQAIKDGERIDWEKLDGMQAKCVHESMGTLNGTLSRDFRYPINFSAGHNFGDFAGVAALSCAWSGENGWTLYVKGAIPMKRKTADQLPLGTCFKGKVLDPLSDEDPDYPYCQLLDAPAGHKQVVAYRTSMATMSIFHKPQNISVIEEYGIGTFKVES